MITILVLGDCGGMSCTVFILHVYNAFIEHLSCNVCCKNVELFEFQLLSWNLLNKTV